MPGIGRGSHRYWPQLDGVRALAIGAVVAFHLGYLPGGWVGVDVFFVLSGYLITSLLLERAEDRGHGGTGVALEGFWGRRARRLLPAVLVLLGVLSLYCALGGPGVVAAQLRAPALATLFYVANWQQIVADSSYFHQFAAPNPLQHTWSLAIEEQYYLVWPLLLGGLTWLCARYRAGLGALVAVVAALALASATWMSVAAHLYGANRAYLGTDTRVWELLLGGIGALIWPLHRCSPSRTRRLWAILGPIGLAGVAVGAARAGGAAGPPWWIWDGGLVAIALCATMVVLSCMLAPAGPLARVLRLPPLRWLGLISYSLYLWHWPVIVLMTSDTTGLDGAALLVSRLAAMGAASCASYLLVERPLRRAQWARLARRLRVPVVSFAGLGMTVTAVVVLVGTVAPPEATSGQVAVGKLAAVGRGSTVSSGGVVSGPGQVVRLRLAPASPGHPYRAWIFGDSVMADSSLGVAAALDSTGDVKTVANTTIGGWGMSTDTSWPGDALGTLSTFHPEIAIATWSWDDSEAQSDPVGYRRRLENTLRLILDHGVKLVVLLEFPQPGPNIETTYNGQPLDLTTAQRWAAWAKLTASQDAWDAVAKSVVAALPGRALYLRTSALFAPGGYFRTWLRTADGTWVRARKLDNAHFCPYGAAALGALVTLDLTPVLHLGAMAPGWQSGTWIHDPRYDDPPGACPADQPPTPQYRGLRVPALSTRSGRP